MKREPSDSTSYQLHTGVYNTTHQHDGPSRIWWECKVLIAETESQSDAEVICRLLNQYKDVKLMYRHVSSALGYAEDGVRDFKSETDYIPEQATKGTIKLWMLSGLLGEMDKDCRALREEVGKAADFGEQRAHHGKDDAWVEARLMAGMAHGNRGLADHGGLELDDKYGEE